MKKKKNESISEILLNVSKNLLEVSDNIDSPKKELIIENTIKLNEAILFLKGLRKLFYIMLFSIVSLLILLVIFISSNNKFDKLNKQFIEIQNDSITSVILDLKKTLNPDSTFSTTYHYITKNGKIITYNQLNKENDSLIYVLINKNNEIINKNIEIISLNNKIQLAKSNYDIDFKISNEKSGNYTTIESKKLDSALVLLELYRDKLYYNKKDSTWNIKN